MRWNVRSRAGTELVLSIVEAVLVKYRKMVVRDKTQFIPFSNLIHTQLNCEREVRNFLEACTNP